ncbi:MAG: alpha/beta fold hydrolase [Acidobacteriota bacterium]
MGIIKNFLIGSSYLPALFIMPGTHTAPDLIRGTAKSHGTDLYYEIIGYGSPVIAVHGGPGLNHRYFLPHLESMAKNHKLILFDMRACGDSGGVLGSTITEKLLLDDLDSIRTSLNLDKVTLLGHSFGGLLAAHYAEIFPGKVKALILVDPLPPVKSAYDTLESNFKKRLTDRDNIYLAEISSSEDFKSHKASAIEALEKIIFSTYLYDKNLISKIDLSGSEATAFNFLTYYAQINNSIDYDYIQNNLLSISARTLIIHGDYDPLPYQMVQQMSGKIPDSKFVLFHNCGHVPFVEVPELFSRSVTEFLAETYK